jgi:hypothetical protein
MEWWRGDWVGVVIVAVWGAVKVVVVAECLV